MIICGCENCGRLDDDCPLCQTTKTNSKGYGCVFWVNDTADLFEFVKNTRDFSRGMN